MNKLITWFNGKKTGIGAILLTLAVVIPKFAGIWEFDPEWLPKIIQTLEYTGMIFTGGGLGHKAVKK